MLATLPSSVDIAVVGGGLAGAATAWALRASGKTVVVLEREAALGCFASGKNAGLARQLVDDDDGSRLTTAGVAWLSGPGRECAEFVATGSILTFENDAARQRYAERATRLGVAYQLIASTELAAFWPQLKTVHTPALLVPGDGTFNPMALLRSYLVDVPVVMAASVLSASKISDDVELRTSVGDVRARIVVNAAGAWAGPVASALGTEPPELSPIKRHITLANYQVPAHTPYVWHLGTEQAYARPHPDGVLLSSCDSRVAAPDEQAVDLGASAVERLARLSAWAPTLCQGLNREHGCIRTFGPGGKPHVAVDERYPWLLSVVGLGGHGATTSSVIGKLAAKLALDALA